jgi:tetratricopeptide (TPR) repeat protein
MKTFVNIRQRGLILVDYLFMRVERRSSRLTFRKPRRRAGCLSLAMWIGLLVGVVAVSWNWLGERLQFGVRPTQQDTFNEAREAFERGDLDSAITSARRAYEQQPDNEDALILLARALIYRSYTDYDRAIDRERALELTTAGLSSAPRSVKRLAIQAYALQAAGQSVAAAQIAEEALRHDPNNGLARVARALAYGGVGSFETALRESQRASLSLEWQLEGQRAQAISYSDLGDYQNAILSVERAIQLNRFLIPLYFERALYALQIGDTDSATAAYYQVLTYDPENVKARLRLCELSSLLRERDKAIQHCSDVTTRAPSWSDGWYHLGMEYFLQGDFRAAQSALNRCSSLQVMQNVPVTERRFECWYLQGQAAEILGDCENLIATYNEFRAMAKDAAIQQTWTYPPEGPPGCAGAAQP